MKRELGFAVVVGAAMFWSSTSNAEEHDAVPSYTLTDLGSPVTPDPNFCTEIASRAQAINSHGDVAGNYCDVVLKPPDIFGFREPEVFIRGFRTTENGLIDLGAPISETFEEWGMQIHGIDDHGTIIGEWSIGEPVGFLLQGGTFTNLPTLPGGNQAIPYGINGRGQITGIANRTNPSTQRAFLYYRGQMTDLGALTADGSSQGMAINERGHIAGAVGPAGGLEHAALWKNGRWRDLGTLPGDVFSIAEGIDIFDEVVGYSEHLGISQAFLWQGRMTPLPALPGSTSSFAIAINDSGTVIGWIAEKDNANPTAVLWNRGNVHDLNDLVVPHDPLRGQVHLSLANGINNRGEVVADGCYTNGPKSGQCDGFVLEPRGEDEGEKLAGR